MIDPKEFSIWYPETDDIKPSHERSVSFLEYCLKVKPRDGMASRSDFSLETLKPWLGNIMILELDPDREDFRYRLYGSEIASRTGFEMTGKWVADLGPDVGDILREQYLRAVREERLCRFACAVRLGARGLSRYGGGEAAGCRLQSHGGADRPVAGVAAGCERNKELLNS